MRRAGYEVRVLPEEDRGWEENPPTMLEFARRDVRWCQGNMQYWPFLLMPGLKPMSRFQLVGDPDVPRLARLDRVVAAGHSLAPHSHRTRSIRTMAGRCLPSC